MALVYGPRIRKGSKFAKSLVDEKERMRGDRGAGARVDLSDSEYGSLSQDNSHDQLQDLGSYLGRSVETLIVGQLPRISLR